MAIPVKCNIHPWMHGYFVVVKGPYAVTDDSGSYTHRKRTSRQLYGDRLAGNLRNPNAEGDGGSRPVGDRELYLQGEIGFAVRPPAMSHRRAELRANRVFVERVRRVWRNSLR